MHWTSTLHFVDWVYLSGHLLVLGIALTRPGPMAVDFSWGSSVSVVVCYTYAYAQIGCLKWWLGTSVWPEVGLVLVLIGACLSIVSLLSLGWRFGIWPAYRGLATAGPYRIVRHPIYLAYLFQDIGYNLCEANLGTVLLTLAGWASLVYRIGAEERMLSRDLAWSNYAAKVRYRLLPGIW